ncbi:MAG TPA: S-methyl-5-thioribose-1-phosphate isomerase, partial [Bacteroidetes bacterium]|nr:S-methyl-5-thioribose-1-phosphate isomerase [Bacteroidota bacterium]
KIGTLGLAILAKHFGIPFYVAAPYSTFDPSIPTGKQIPIEQRHADEVLRFRECQSAPRNVQAWNPAFDVTPAELIGAFITDRGIIRPPFSEQIQKRSFKT